MRTLYFDRGGEDAAGYVLRWRTSTPDAWQYWRLSSFTHFEAGARVAKRVTRRLCASTLRTVAGIAISIASGAPAHGWVLTVTPGTRAIFLQVGNGANNANLGTINVVSVAVPSAAVGSGTAQAMTTDSTQSTSFFDGFAVCNPPAQMYVGGFFRQPSTTAATATVQVASPTNLVSGTDTIPFSQISWTSTANGNATADIPAGSFTGGTQFLVNIPSNRWLENCHVFSYANASVVPAGTFTGRVVYTMTAP